MMMAQQRALVKKLEDELATEKKLRWQSDVELLKLRAEINGIKLDDCEVDALVGKMRLSKGRRPRSRSRSAKKFVDHFDDDSKIRRYATISITIIFRLIFLLVAFTLILLHLTTPSNASIGSFACSGSSWMTIPTFPQHAQTPQTTTITTEHELAPLSPLHHKIITTNTDSSCPTPSFHNKGGVFIFFHLAKAGGTTVRFMFQNLTSSHVKARALVGTADSTVRHWLTNTTEDRSLLVEFHDHGNPSVAKYQGFLQDWRKLASLHNKPLFVFTIVRNPVDYALSFFTYMNVRTGRHPSRKMASRYEHHDGSGRKAELLQEDFLNFTLPSPQCLFFSRGEYATTSEFPVYASKFDQSQECPEIYDTMTKYMDWIGTVETMQEELLPLLTYLTDQDPQIGSSFERRNTPKKFRRIDKFVQETKANNTTMAALLPKLEGDQFLYQRVQQDYSFHSFWSQCIMGTARVVTDTADVKPN